MSKIINTFFTENGIPKTGITPTVDIWDTDGNQVVTAANMTEIAGGFYTYTFATFDSTKNYVIRSDGGASLPVSERYQIGNIDPIIDNILKVETNRNKIIDNQLLYYDDDGTTVIYTFDLKDLKGNPSHNYVFERDPV